MKLVPGLAVCNTTQANMKFMALRKTPIIILSYLGLWFLRSLLCCCHCRCIVNATVLSLSLSLCYHWITIDFSKILKESGTVFQIWVHFCCDQFDSGTFGKFNYSQQTELQNENGFTTQWSIAKMFSWGTSGEDIAPSRIQKHRKSYLTFQTIEFMTCYKTQYSVSKWGSMTRSNVGMTWSSPNLITI